jgi:hypothetical protein
MTRGTTTAPLRRGKKPDTGSRRRVPFVAAISTARLAPVTGVVRDAQPDAGARAVAGGGTSKLALGVRAIEAAAGLRTLYTYAVHTVPSDARIASLAGLRRAHRRSTAAVPTLGGRYQASAGYLRLSCPVATAR